MKRFYSSLLLGILIALTACGTGLREDAGQPAKLHQGEVLLADVLAELDALPVPAGADPAQFEGLKQALREYLENTGSSKFATAVPTDTRNSVQDLTLGFTDLGEPGVQWNYRNVGDYNFDGEVNVSDITPLGADLGKTTASPDWDSAQFSDGDENGEVNISDITPIGAHLFNQVMQWQLQGADSPEGPFAPLQTVERLGDGSVKLGAGMIAYNLVPAVQKPYYRVLPLDNAGTEGIESNVSVQFIISDETRVIGDPGMPSFASRNGDQIVLNNVPGEPLPIAVGDIIVGEEQDGYMLRVVSLTPQGDQTVVEGEPAPMKDVFLQGAVGAKFNADGSVVEPFGKTVTKAAAAQPPIPDYDFDISDQTLHDSGNLRIDIEEGTFNFLPNADVAINYSRYRGVTYLKALLDSDALKLYMLASVLSTGFNGSFPLPGQQILFEKHITSLVFNLSTRQNGVPVVVAAQYDIYLGTSGSGEFDGEIRAGMDAVYRDLLLGGIYTPGEGVENFNQSTPYFNSIGVPTLPRTGGDFSWRVYVRPEVHMKLYGNPVPGSSEDLDLHAIPYMNLTATRTTSPEDGYNYQHVGAMDNYYKMQLFHLGSTDVQEAYQDGAPHGIRQGFEPDGGALRRLFSGEVQSAGGPLPGIRVYLTNELGNFMAVDTTDDAGLFSFDWILDGATVTVRPIEQGYSFTPQFATEVMDADKFAVFVAD